MNPSKRFGSLCVLVVLVATACGTRTDRARTGDLAGPRRVSAPVVPASPAAKEAVPQAGGSVNPAATEPLGASKVPASPRAASTSELSPAGAAAGVTGTTRTESRPVPGATREGSPGRPDGAERPGGLPPRPPNPAPAPTTLSPILVASVGTVSGPAGATLRPGVEAFQAWVADKNAAGGINGHPIRHLVFDDGGDPARHKAEVQEAVERHGVIAFVYNIDGFAGQASQSYITAKRVPVIGSEAGSRWFYDSPVYFPQASSGQLMFAQGIYSAAQRLVPPGTTRKLATTTCAEAAECATVDKVWAEEGPKVGFEVVYRNRSSIAQPDYTAECLAARNAAADVFLIALDTASISRLALSCVRQGYRPVFATVSTLVADRMKEDPNLEGLVASSNVFPYFQSGTAATDEYQRVMTTYGKNVTAGVAAALGWVSAKLFEKAAAGMTEPPSSEALLRSLWSLRGESLGGITHPLTFTENHNAPKTQCWFDLVIKKGVWISPDGYRLNCR